jgi:hypothetical protein
LCAVRLVVAFATGPSPVLAIIGILLFTMAFHFGYAPLSGPTLPKLPPARTQGGSAMLTSDLAANIVIGIVFLSALGALGGAWTFAIFAVLSRSRSSSCTCWPPRRRDASSKTSAATGTTVVAGQRRESTATATAAGSECRDVSRFICPGFIDLR